MTFLGVDIGTGSTKAVVTDPVGRVLASAVRSHTTATPHPGWFEHDADDVWWADFRAVVAQVLATAPADGVEAVCVSGIGPVALLTDEAGRPVRPAVLYGIDSRAQQEIADVTGELGTGTLLDRTGNLLTTQAVGPKLRWITRHEPEIWTLARRWYGCAGYVAGRLTGEYVVDHYTASTSDPLYDLRAHTWWDQGWEASAPGLKRPRLAWPGDVVGTVLATAAEETGLRAGTLVLAGTVDAMAEAYSVGSRDVGDMMVMYGSTLFLIQTVARPATHAGLWAATGRTAATWSIAAGMATSGLVTSWLADLVGADVGGLTREAAGVAPGSDGLVLLPYFAGERTPLFDPQARGCWLGLTLGHGRAHLYRSALEGVGYGVRHNVEAMVEAGAPPGRLVAVGGGTTGCLWTQVVSDITGLPQDLPSITIGAAYGDARMAADACGVDTSSWNPVKERVLARPELDEVYTGLYNIYRRTYAGLRDDMHLLAERFG